MTSTGTNLERDGTVHKQEFADHTILTPPNRLKQRAARIVESNGVEHADPVRRAENALKLLSNEFGAWMDAEIHELETARDAAAGANDVADLSSLFRVAHNIRGQAATLGYPLVGQIADGLCILIDRSRKVAPSQELIDLHVNAIRALVREGVQTRDNPVASALVHRLRQVRTDAVGEP